MEHYYFFSYYRITQFGSTFESGVTESHPFMEIKALNSYYNDESYTLISFKEISKKEFDYFNGDVDDI